MLSWEEKSFQPPKRARRPWEEFHTSGWCLGKSCASLQMGSEQLADLSGQRSNCGIFTSGKRSTMPTASPTAARESSMSSSLFFVFVYRLVSIQGFGRETPAPERSVHGGSLHIHPTQSQSSLSTFIQHMYWFGAIKRCYSHQFFHFVQTKE